MMKSSLFINLIKSVKPDTKLIGGKAVNIYRILHSKHKIRTPKAIVVPSNIGEVEIRTSEKELLGKIQEIFGNKQLFAVRSSAPSEDGFNDSYAGQYNTELNVPFGKLVQAIITVKQSATNSKSNIYILAKKKTRNVCNSNVAVIVQPMVNNVEFAGVVFSNHPIERDSRIISIEIVRGLGEALVSGKKTPLSIRYNSVTKQYRVENNGNDRINDKEARLVIKKLMEEINKVNEEYDYMPIDIEWAFANNHIYILQVRPITTIDTDKQKNKIIVVAGMTGVGKDFIVNRIDTKGLNIIGWGDKLGEFLGADKDLMMSETPKDIISEYQSKVCDYVVKNTPIITICHPVKDEDGEYTFNIDIEQKLNPICYIYVKAPATAINRRVINRNKLGDRKSKELSISTISKLQKIELQEIKRLSKILNTKLVVINNVNFVLKSNIKKIDYIINRVIRES